MEDCYLVGFISGLIASSGLFFVYRASRYSKALSLTDMDKAMSHDDLFAATLSSNGLVTVLDTHVHELCEEYACAKEQLRTLESHLDEAMTRNIQLHKEIAQMARVANNLQDEVSRGQLEIDHCRACCDELREKLNEKVGA